MFSKKVSASHRILARQSETGSPGTQLGLLATGVQSMDKGHKKYFEKGIAWNSNFRYRHGKNITVFQDFTIFKCKDS